MAVAYKESTSGVRLSNAVDFNVFYFAVKRELLG